MGAGQGTFCICTGSPQEAVNQSATLPVGEYRGAIAGCSVIADKSVESYTIELTCSEQISHTQDNYFPFSTYRVPNENSLVVKQVKSIIENFLVLFCKMRYDYRVFAP